MANLPSTLFLLATTLTLACSSPGNDPESGDDEPATPDASAATPDSAQPGLDALVGTAAVNVPCEGATIVGDVWFYDGIGYVGSALGGDFTVGSIVQFHDMSTHTADHVQGLFSVSGTEPTCIRFDSLGRYEFSCYFHSEETGAITIVD